MKKAKKAKKQTTKVKSQSAQLKQLSGATKRSMIIGIILLILYSVANLWLSSINAEQLESTEINF